MDLNTFFTLFSSISFIFFGVACFLAPKMKTEFLRYGLDSFREMTGILQLLGGIGVIVGFYFYPLLMAIAAGGLAVLMILGFAVRLKIKDTVIQSLPSLLYALINSYILYDYLQ